LLPGGIIYSTTRARASRPTTWSRHRHARMFLSLDTMAARTQARSAPLAARAVRHAGPRRLVAFPHTMALQQRTAVTVRRHGCAYRTPLHYRPHLLRAQRTRWSFPIAGSAFTAPSRAKYISSKYHSRRPTRVPGVLPHYPSLEASSCPALGVRRAASPKDAASTAGISHRACRLHRLPVRRTHPLHRRWRPLETSACSAPGPSSPGPPRTTRDNLGSRDL
jgi:hypothetical protein